jgi:hypothetical protein
MTLAALVDLQIIGVCCALIAVAWALSYGFEWVGEYVDRTATKPDYHRIAFLEDREGLEHIDVPPMPHRCLARTAIHIQGRGHTNFAHNVTDGP